MYIILILFFVTLIIVVVALNSNNYENGDEFKKVIEEIECFFEDLSYAKKGYFTDSQKLFLIEKFKSIYLKINSTNRLLNSKNSDIQKFSSIFKSIHNYVAEFNEGYVKNELIKYEKFFNDIDGKSLDFQQRRAVVVDEDNNLILAGAGSGKTLTISAKVKYLVEVKKIDPSKILLISFTKKAANEMYERISGKFNINVESVTFHKLGFDIFSNNQGYRPSVLDEMNEIISRFFTEEFKNDKKLTYSIIHLFSYFFRIPKSFDEFNSMDESIDHLKGMDLETIKSKIKYIENEKKSNKITFKHERVKSIEEVTIANFLYLNGIDYIYETKYKHNTNDPYRKVYSPDFYLPKYDLYIEHFGITEDNRVPWLSKVEEKKYLDSIKWKRKIHIQNNTKLLETYSFWSSKGVLLDKLEGILKDNNVEFKPLDLSKIYEQLYIQNKNDSMFGEFISLICTFINLAKSKKMSAESIMRLGQSVTSENRFLGKRTELFFNLITPAFNYYQNELIEDNNIDFNDMINLATDIVDSGEYSKRFDYIIIDEYQDTSVSRFNLVNSIRKLSNAKVICVGDDWQSIYRFAGSDIDLFLQFEKYWGKSELLKIESTYRNSQELIDIAGQFIMTNPVQFKKQLKSSKTQKSPIILHSFGSNNVSIINAFTAAIESIVLENGEESDIMVIGRNNSDIFQIVPNPKDNDSELETTYSMNRTKDDTYIKCLHYPKLRIKYLTVHRSKGLEARNVIIINLTNDIKGFPNQIASDPILNFVQTEPDEFAFSEERRLFYVALTRTQQKTYLIAPEKRQSVFVKELLEAYEIEAIMSGGEELDSTSSPKCPKCLKGDLILRTNEQTNSKFIGCSNYPFCDKTFSNIEILNDQIKCNVCEGYMVKRTGTYGEFYGCTNYPDCHNKLRIEVKYEVSDESNN